MKNVLKQRLCIPVVILVLSSETFNTTSTADTGIGIINPSQTQFVNNTSFLSLNMVDLIKMKDGFTNKNKQDLDSVNAIIFAAEKEIELNYKYTIVNKPYFPPGIGKHDYVSVLPYWWPNPDTEDGFPYVRKDGQVNPEARTKFTDQKNLASMAAAVENLGLAYFFTDNKKYATRVEQIIKVFFLDEDTYMKPNLEYGQSRPTKQKPVGTMAGIIETAVMVRLLEGFGLASMNGDVSNEVVVGLKEWIREYLQWCDKSMLGIAARNGKQNHSTYYDLQTLAYRLFLSDYDGVDYLNEARGYIKKYTCNRLLLQIKRDGSQPGELGRTKSWSYANINLAGMYKLALIAEKVGVDLWHFKGDRDVPPLKAAVDWFLPYLTKEKPWKWKQIQKEQITKLQWCLQIAYQRYNDGKYINAIKNFQTIHPNIIYGF